MGVGEGGVLVGLFQEILKNVIEFVAFLCNLGPLLYKLKYTTSKKELLPSCLIYNDANRAGNNSRSFREFGKTLYSQVPLFG